MGKKRNQLGVSDPIYGDYKSRIKSIKENISYDKGTIEGTILLLIRQNQIGYYKFQ